MEKVKSAYQSGQTDLSTHPALPQDASRHAELKKILDNVLRIDPPKAIKRTAQFEVLGEKNLPPGMPRRRPTCKDGTRGSRYPFNSGA